jgi:PEGA domain-containing protein
VNSRLSVLCCFLLAAQTGGAPVFASQQANAPQQALIEGCRQPCLEDGTPVKLRFAQTVSSEDAHVNDHVEFEVLEEIRVSDVVIIPKGGVAWGTVTEAQPKRRMARGGKLEVVMDSVRLVDGEKAALRATKEVKGGGHTGAMTAGIVVTGLIIWPAAPFFLFMHGKEITIPKDTEVPTFVNGNFQLDLSRFQQQPSVAAQPQIAPTPSATATEIAVTSDPAGADIELDGTFVGNTPSSIGVSAGDHTIAINKHGFKLWQRKIKVSGGQISVAAELEATGEPDTVKQATDTAAPLASSTSPPAPPPSHDTTAPPSQTLVTINITSEPDGAEINIDNADVGKAPMNLELAPGRHAFRMFMDGYENWVQWITIQAGPDVHVTATLEKSK